MTTNLRRIYHASGTSIVDFYHDCIPKYRLILTKNMIFEIKTSKHYTMLQKNYGLLNFVQNVEIVIHLNHMKNLTITLNI